MIYPQTMLTVADNTGARKIMCIRVLGGNRKYAKIGDSIIGVVKEAIPNMPIKKSDIVKAIIVRTAKSIRRKDGMFISFDDNAAVIVNVDNNPRGTRVFGPVAREIRDKNFSKIVSLAPEVL
tara:strand:+ start:230 stop:595 length:366 start_codon:yes stop_codon:yes gene_type:complete